MKGTWENDEIWHTCRDGYEQWSDHFGVSKTTSIAPPPVQIFNIEMVITREPLSLENET